MLFTPFFFDLMLWPQMNVFVFLKHTIPFCASLCLNAVGSPSLPLSSWWVHIHISKPSWNLLHIIFPWLSSLCYSGTISFVYCSAYNNILKLFGVSLCPMDWLCSYLSGDWHGDQTGSRLTHRFHSRVFELCRNGFKIFGFFRFAISGLLVINIRIKEK